MADHVLVPMDDSEPARSALEYACERHPDASITVLHVIDPTDVGAYTPTTDEPSAEFEAEIDRKNEVTEAIFDTAREIAAGYDRTVSTETTTGETADAIVSVVDERDVDLVAMGSHGRRGVSRILLGSVAETVARRVDVPVTIVR